MALSLDVSKWPISRFYLPQSHLFDLGDPVRTDIMTVGLKTIVSVLSDGENRMQKVLSLRNTSRQTDKQTDRHGALPNCRSAE